MVLWIPKTDRFNNGVSISVFILPSLATPQLILFISTCFWGGDIFAPKLLVKNQHNQEVPIQQFLQTAFLDMWDMVVRAVGDLRGVMGVQVSFLLLFHLGLESE